MNLKGMRCCGFTVFFVVFWLKSFAVNLQQDSVQLNRFFYEVKKHIDANKLDSAAKILQQARRLSFVSNDSLGMRNQVKYLKFKFDILFRKSRHTDALKVGGQLMKLSVKLKDKQLISEIYYAIAAAENALGKLNVAAENIVKAIKISERLADHRLRIKYYQLLSDIFLELRESKKALYYSTKAYEIAKDKGRQELTKAKLNLILSEVLAGQFENAQLHLKEVESDIDKRKEPFELSKVYLYLSHLYFEKKEYQLSIDQLNKIPPYYNLVSATVDLPLHTEIAMAESYAALKMYRKASFYFNKNIDQALKKMDSGDIKICLKLGAAIYEGLGDSGNTISYLKKYAAFNDSLSKISLNKAIHETEIRYQTTLKEKAISEQKLQLIHKDYELQKKNRYIIIGFSAIFLLVLSGLIIYLAYRNRTQSIELSLLKAQIHPHFLFNTLNNLYALSMNKSDEAPGVVMGLSNILRYILYECNSLHADLRKEMDMISEYIKLERIRYTGGLEVNTYFDEGLEGYTIAPLLLLPLVENAYKHGVNKLEGDSWINIEAKIKEDKFIFKISNNKPIAKNQLIPKSIYGNIGLKNIKKRLDIIYPKKHRFKIIDSEDIFMVTLELTVKRN